jgi:hypothetical protein
MRPLFVWITVAILLFVESMGWYLTVPIVLGISHGIQNYTNGTQAGNIVTIIEVVAFVWGPIMMLFTVLWGFVAMGTRDAESEMYY